MSHKTPTSFEPRRSGTGRPLVRTRRQIQEEVHEPMTPTIEAAGLIKRFGKTRALDGLDLVAEPGQVVAVLGPNGAGKTTFVRAVGTKQGRDRGSLHVAGHDVGREPEAVRRAIGLAGQSAAVEPAMTGRENLEMVARLFGHSRRSARSSSASVLEQLGLTDAADRLARTYSGGMRRKLDLGASLVGAPRLLLLDEPTTGLDPGGGVRWAAYEPARTVQGHTQTHAAAERAAPAGRAGPPPAFGWTPRGVPVAAAGDSGWPERFCRRYGSTSRADPDQAGQKPYERPPPPDSAQHPDLTSWNALASWSEGDQP